MYGLLTSVHVMVMVLAAATGLSVHHQLEARQSSDGCGPNPLVAVISYAREFADFSPQQLMRFIEMDTRAGSQLRTLLRTYDDCVRTGDGTRYKKSWPTAETLDPSSKKKHSLQQANQSILRALML